MAQLARQAAIPHISPGPFVDRRRVKRFRDLLELRRTELVALRAEQAPGFRQESVESAALALRGLSQQARVGLAREDIGLGPLERVTRLEQGVALPHLRPDQLVDRPRRDRRLVELGDRGRLVAAALLPQALGQRVAL